MLPRTQASRRHYPWEGKVRPKRKFWLPSGIRTVRLNYFLSDAIVPSRSTRTNWILVEREEGRMKVSQGLVVIQRTRRRTTRQWVKMA